MIHIVHPLLLYSLLPLIALAAYWYWFHYKNPLYRFSSAEPFKSLAQSTQFSRITLFLLRLATLGALTFAIARFQVPDERSKVPVQGIDIMLVLDVSGSMNLPSDEAGKKTRMDVAREEAIKFIEKRDNDPIGLVIFAGEAVSRCPLTLDRRVLREILNETSTTTIQAPGTVISRAILTAANRLKKSTAKSRIMILLTDGEPTREDVDPRLAINMAKKLGIKIYTIGIESEGPIYIDHPFFGKQRVESQIDIPLLKSFADQTGGMFFRARNADEMKEIYNTIDKLETTSYETPIFARYFEYFMPLLWIAALLLLIEILLSCFYWVRL